jgi:dihydroflavonol-4-reductase
MKIFITGGTGYIGGALCRRLSAEKHEIHALVRPTSDRRLLEDLGIACFEGDITDRDSMRNGMDGAEWVIHAAAELDFGSPLDRMEGANAVGSENVAALALELAIGRTVHISSIASFGGTARDGTPSTEVSEPQLPLPNNYCVTKNAGEVAFRRKADEGLALNIVYPSLVYGPPSKKGGINSFLRLMLTGRLPALVGADRVSSWIFLDDLVEGVVRMMERAVPGEHYLMTGERCSTADVTARVCELGGSRRPRLAIPVSVARALLFAAAPFEILTRRRLPFNNQQLRTLNRHWSFDDSKARRALDWTPRGLDEGLPPTVAFLKGTIGRRS